MIKFQEIGTFFVRRYEMKWVLYCFLIMIILVIVITFIDMKRIKTVIYKSSSNKIKKNVRIVFISDLHNNVFGKENIRLLNKIKKLNPNYIFIGGDMMVANGNTEFKVAENFIKALAKDYKVFYALGNHEYRVKIYKEDYDHAYEKYIDSIQGSNVVMLDNKTVLLEEGIKVSGLTLSREFYHRLKKIKAENMELNSYIGDSNSDEFHLLLAHNPMFFENYDAWGADLTLSGHLHGGIMKLPMLGGVISSSFQLFPKYDGGEFVGENGKMIVSRGLGAHTIPIRVFNPCELVCIDIEKEDAI